jgi:hypothetical protein
MDSYIFMEEKAPRKTTAKKTVRASAEPKVAAPRKRKTTSTVAAPAVTVRKAPRVAPTAPAGVSRRVSHRKLKVVSVGLLLFVLLFGVSAMIGMSDTGQLDVSEKIAQRKLDATDEERRALETVPTQQNAPSVPNGGLVGMGSPEPQPAEVTASSSEQNATGTPEVSDTPADAPIETGETVVSDQVQDQADPAVAGAAI